jgi:hypothetical protein
MSNDAKQISKLLARVKKLPAALAKINAEIKNVDKRMKALDKAGLIYAAMHWRKEKYLLLVYPMKNGERPTPTYIGTDEKKIQESKDGIARADEFERLKVKMRDLKNLISSAENALLSLESALML